MEGSYAVFCLKKKQLANGVGLLSDDREDVECWEGAAVHTNESRLLPVVWTKDSAEMFNIRDDVASYGNQCLHSILGIEPVSMSRRVALLRSDEMIQNRENIGDDPFGLPPPSICLTGPRGQMLRPGGLVEGAGNTAASAKTRPDPAQLWLVDTGCGHDLVSSGVAKAAKIKTQRLPMSVTFQTANGETPSTHSIPLKMRELDETICPFVLKDTPSVISVGKRTMNDGYSFVWNASENPYFITPKGKVIPLEVLQDIPYLRRNSSTCGPRKASERDYMIRATPSVREDSPSRDAEGISPEEGVRPGDEGISPNEDGHVQPPPDVPEDRDGEVARRNLRQEARSLNRLLTH